MSDYTILTSIPDLVKKSNAIARANWKPESIWEARIVALVASKVKDSDKDFYTYVIPVSELTGQVVKNLGGLQYNEIKQSILRLSKTQIVIQEPDSKDFMSYTIFCKCGYRNGCIIAEFHPDLKSHFLNLKEQFTTYSLLEYLKLPSMYSQKLFDLLKSWSKMPQVIITMENLHKFLETPSSLRDDFSLFRKRVLEKAYKDITEKTTLKYQWKALKIGKSVERIVFYFGELQEDKLDKQNQIAKLNKDARIQNQRFIVAAKCADSKQHVCEKQSNKRIICKMCKTLHICRDIHW